MGGTMTRNNEMMSDREAGMTLSELSEKYGVSRERVRQICRHVELTREREDDELWQRLEEAARRIGRESVVMRTYNIVKRGMRISLNERIPFEEVPRERWHELRNCGEKSLELLYEAFPE